MSRFNQESASAFLRQTGIFYYDTVENERASCERSEKNDKYAWTEQDTKEHLEEVAACQHTLNQNDTWGWALAWGVPVSDDKLVEVADLYWKYGYCGILYWVSEQNDKMKSEFHDVNRAIEFVRNEERIIKTISEKHPGNSSALAYHKESYTIGE